MQRTEKDEYTTVTLYYWMILLRHHRWTEAYPTEALEINIRHHASLPSKRGIPAAVLASRKLGGY